MLRRTFIVNAVASALLAAGGRPGPDLPRGISVSYTHLRAHETVLDLVCRLLLEKKKERNSETALRMTTHTVNYARITYQH